MNWTFLSFIGQASFVLPWYAIGALGLLYLIYDLRHHNTVLEPAMKWAWPIIVLFFSVITFSKYCGLVIHRMTNTGCQHAILGSYNGSPTRQTVAFRLRRIVRPCMRQPRESVRLLRRRDPRARCCSIPLAARCTTQSGTI
jgi:hypothetical protein